MMMTKRRNWPGELGEFDFAVFADVKRGEDVMSHLGQHGVADFDLLYLTHATLHISSSLLSLSVHPRLVFPELLHLQPLYDQHERGPTRHFLSRKHVVRRLDCQKSVHWWGLGVSRKIGLEQKINKDILRNQQATCHVRAPRPPTLSNMWYVIPTSHDIGLYIPSFIEIRSGVSEPNGGRNLPFWPLSHYFG